MHSAVPLLHATTPLAFLAFIIALRRKKWAAAALIVTIASMYLAHSLMLTAATVASGYYAANIHYFLPAYVPMICTAFFAISILLRLNAAED